MFGSRGDGGRVVWLLWGLVAIGLSSIVGTLGRTGWTLVDVRHETARSVARGAQLIEASRAIGHAEGRALAEIQNLMDPERREPPNRAMIDEFFQLIRRLRSTDPHISVAQTLAHLEATEDKLRDLWGQAVNWRTRYDVVREQIETEHPVHRVRELLSALRGTLDVLQGRHNLRRAIEVRKSRAEGASVAPVEPLKTRRTLATLKGEVADLATLAERLAGEENVDNLTNLKDNQLKLSLDRLARNLPSLNADPSAAGMVSPATLYELQTAFFGSGFSLDVAHQTVRVGRDGLYAFRRSVLEFRLEKEALTAQTDALFSRLDALNAELGHSAQALTEQLEAGVHRALDVALRDAVLWSLIGGTAFLLLASLITRTIRRQLAMLAEAKAAALEATRLKSEFLANMSHEIRTPMVGVIGTTDLLRRTELDATQLDLVETTRHSATALLTIINDILDLSKLEAGKLALEPAPLDLRTLAEQVAELLAPGAFDKGLDLVVRYAPEAPRYLVGDAHRLRQVLTNLVSNAIKFTESGHIVISVTAEAVGPRETGVRVAVADTGLGIAEDEVARLFEKFTQADASTTRRFGGTGLGLAISRQLTEMMGGTIGAESRAGVGSTFWFSVHLPRDTKAAPARAEHPAFSGARVLILSARPATRAALCEQLETWHMSVTEVETGTDALRAIESAAEPFSVVLVDTRDCDGDPGEVARTVRAITADAGTRLIVLNPKGSDEHGIRTSFDAMVRLPVGEHALVDVLSDTECSPVAAGAEDATPQASIHARVLVADDVAVNQKVARAMLEALGCDVELAADGAQALRMHSTTPYDLIFMDCHMPEVDGYEATRAIRHFDAPVRHTPIIGLTASAMQADRELCLAAGMDYHLPKPVETADLARALERWLPSTSRDTPSASTDAPETPETPAMPPRSAERKIFDHEATLKRLGGRAPILLALTRLLPVQAAESLLVMKQAVEERDAKAIEEAAHKLRGSFASLSSFPAHDAAHRLERMGNTHGLDDVDDALRDLEYELDRLLPEIAAWAAQHAHLDTRTDPTHSSPPPT